MSKEDKKIPKRGFITIATGDARYYQMALNLLHSYRLNGNADYPFAILCDRICPEAQEFDDIILMEDPTRSFLDKLALYRYAPYEETIFIDADCLVLQDVNVYWEELSTMDDFCCYGRKLPLESREGWFYYEGMGDLKPLIKQGISLQGGVYYLRKTDRCRAIFEKAIELTKVYDRYSFCYFSQPADEPVLALSMVLMDCDPCPVAILDRIAVLPGNERRFRVSAKGALFLDKKPSSASVLHFGNRNLDRFLYRYSLELVNSKLQGKKTKYPRVRFLARRIKYFPTEIKHKFKRQVRKCLSKDAFRYLKQHLSKKLVSRFHE